MLESLESPDGLGCMNSALCQTSTLGTQHDVTAFRALKPLETSAAFWLATCRLLGHVNYIPFLVLL